MSKSKELGMILWNAFHSHMAKNEALNSEALMLKVEKQWKTCSSAVFNPNSVGNCNTYQIVAACMSNSVISEALITSTQLRTLLNIGEEARAKLAALTTPPPAGINLAYDISQYCPNAGVPYGWRRIT